MKNFKMVIQYDGTKYRGWQSQKNTSQTIQQKIESVLERMTGEVIEVAASGRTDMGVHAKGQVVNFKSSTTMSCGEILAYVNEYLPEDIGVLSIEEVELRFHSRLNAKGKTYVYRIWNSKLPNVFERKYTYVVKENLDIEAMREAANLLCGEQDFQAFTSTKKSKKSTVRTIYEIQIQEKGQELQLTYHGNGFLYHMVRILTGTLLEVGLGKKKPQEMIEIIKSQDRTKAGYLVPPEGLSLENVEY